MAAPVPVAACQVAIDIDQPPPVGAVEAAVREAAERGARLVVLPELALSGYVFNSRDELEEKAEYGDGPTVNLARRLAAEYRLALVVGFPEREGGKVFNSAVIVDRGEVIGTYRKVHLWDREKLFFDAGDKPPLVVDTSIGRLGVMICYDAEFPEWVRLAAESGAEILAVPANWPRLPRPPKERAIEVAKAQAAAAAYGVNVVVADRCGAERGIDWVGGSLVCGADGYLIAGPATSEADTAKQAVLVCPVETAAAREKNLTSLAHRLGDRRPELY